VRRKLYGERLPTGQLIGTSMSLLARLNISHIILACGYIFFVAKNGVMCPVLSSFVSISLKSISVDSGPYHMCVLYRTLLRITLYNLVSIITSFTNLTSRYPSSIRDKLDSLYLTSVFALWCWAIREKSILLWYAKHCNVTFHWSCIVSLFQCFWHPTRTVWQSSHGILLSGQ
jgi:hypothetical protein